MTRNAVIAALWGWLVAMPVIVAAVLLDWPAISFYGYLLVFALVYLVLFDRAERRAGR